MSTGRPKDGETRLVVAATTAAAAKTAGAIEKHNQKPSDGAVVEYKPPVMQEEGEDLEVKLRRILENVPVRVSNTSGSSAGSGSGDFHQYRQMRRREQDRLSRMDADYQKRKEAAEFSIRREERLKAAEERTAKKRSKRQKKKLKKKEKKIKLNAGGEEQQQQQVSSDDDDGDSDNGE